MRHIRQLLSAALLGLSTFGALRAAEPFEAVATSTDGSNITVRASGSNLVTFIENLIGTDEQFQALNGRPYTAVSTYLAVPNAISLVTNANGTSATVNLNPIGFSRTFTGPTSDNVEDQVGDFFETEGTDILGRFLAAIAKQSAASVTDGNPQSSTAVAANSVFATQGFTPADEIAISAEGGTEKPRYSGIGIGFNAGTFEAAGIEGKNYDFSVTGLNFGLGARTRIVTPVSFSFVKLADADIAGFNIGLAAPTRLRVMDATQPTNWRLTPSLGIGLRGSADLASGALIWQAGITNTIDRKVAPKLVLSLVNQLSHHQSIKVKYEDYEFDPEINQQILKNGVRAVMPLTRRVIGDVFVVHTNFLKDAAVKGFTTIGGAVSLRASQSFNLSIGGNWDTGSNFKAWSIGLSSAWRW